MHAAGALVLPACRCSFALRRDWIDRNMNPHRDRRTAMKTHNLNVNTATPESPKTWVKTPSALWIERKNDLLVHLAEIEGELLMFDALDRMGVEWEEENDLLYCAREAAITVESLSEIGAVNSEAVYEMIKSVEALAINCGRIFWWDTRNQYPVITGIYSSRYAQDSPDLHQKEIL